MKSIKSIVFSVLTLFFLAAAISCSNSFTPQTSLEQDFSSETSNVEFSLGKLDSTKLCAPKTQRNIPKNIKALEPTIKSLPKGIELEGWYTDEELTHKWDFNNKVNSSMVLYPKCLVSVNIYAGVIKSIMEDFSIKVEYGSTIKNNVSLPDGYIIDSWYTDEGLTHKWDINTPITETINLYPKCLVQVSYSTGGHGTNQSRSPIYIEYGTAIGSANVPSLEQDWVWVFTKWTNQHGATMTENNIITEPTSLTANWYVPKKEEVRLQNFKVSSNRSGGNTTFLLSWTNPSNVKIIGFNLKATAKVSNKTVEKVQNFYKYVSSLQITVQQTEGFTNLGGYMEFSVTPILDDSEKECRVALSSSGSRHF